ncbi:MAG: hypothetical protein PUF66_03705 [Clostridium sp.]|nr:hypothetical protein [Clostridium sp.]
MKILMDNEEQVINPMNLEVSTFKKGETHASRLKQSEEELLNEKMQKTLLENKKKSKVKNLKLFGKVIFLSALCIASGKTYKLADDKITEIKEEKAMDDYYKPMSEAIMHNKYFLPENGVVNENKYAYHYDKIGKYIDEESNKIESIYSQNKYVASKDFYIASATKYFENHYGDIDEVIANMKSTGDNATLKDYVKTLGYTSVDDYVDSIYQINYSFKQHGINTEKIKTLK